MAVHVDANAARASQITTHTRTTYVCATMTTPFASCTHAHTQRTGGSSDLPTIWGVRWGALAIGVRRLARACAGCALAASRRRKGGKQRRLGRTSRLGNCIGANLCVHALAAAARAEG